MWLFLLFVLFCGITHFLDAAVSFSPLYNWLFLAKLATAIASWATVIALIPVTPKVLSMKSPDDLEAEVQRRTSELQEAKNQILYSEQLYKQSFHMSGVAKFQCQPPHMKFLLVNKKMCEITGYSEEELLGMTISDLTHPEDRDEDHLCWEQMFRGEHSETNRKKRYVKKDGSIIWVKSNLTTLHDGDGKPFRVMAVIVDITDSLRLKSELQEKIRDLAEANQRKDEFLAILGHELRNPLAALSNAVQLLTLPGSPEDAKILGRDMIQRQLEHITRLVDDIITVSRAVRGRMDLRKEDVAVSDILERAVELVEPLIHLKRHNLQIQNQCHGRKIFGDKIRLVQAVSNLLQNAAKYTENGGEIEIVASIENNDIAILVKDNGMGISGELLPHIFDLCVRGRRATQKDHGMGIGLTMVKSIIELHGGRVVARSQGSDQGSEFIVHLPIRGDGYESPSG